MLHWKDWVEVLQGDITEPDGDVSVSAANELLAVAASGAALDERPGSEQMRRVLRATGDLEHHQRARAAAE